MKRVIGIVTFSIILVSCYSVRADAACKVGKIGDKYEKVQVYEPIKYYDSVEESGDKDLSYNGKVLNDDEKKAVMESRKEKEHYERLVPMTNDNYEVTLSFEDGSYTFVGSSDTYEESVTMANVKEDSSEVKMAGQVVVPTVINSKGEVVYATEEIGRVWKKYADGVRTGRTSLSYVYISEDCEDSYTYISDSYISEVPIIKKNANEAQVLIAGYEGWMNTNIDRVAGENEYPNRDLKISPVTEVTNPSYYTVSNGILKHIISSSMDGNKNNNSVLTIGKAPSYLKEGQTYYSYDGNYFYDGSRGTASALRTLMKDLQRGNYSNAVNKDTPFYNYYNYLPFRSQTSYSADELDRFIESHTSFSSKLRGTGRYFINAQNQYGVNALLALGIAINESGWGNSDYARNRNNLFGINATDDNTNKNTSYYDSVEKCINYFANKLISKGYANPSDWRDYGGFLGNKKFGANVYYASDPYWSEKAVNYAFKADYELSGDNINNLKDYDDYQLLLNTSSCPVVNEKGENLYNILGFVTTRGSHVGAVNAFCKSKVLNFNGQACYAINPEITSSLVSKKFDGNYNWNVKGYIPIKCVESINNGKNYFQNEDVNMDAEVDTLDLSTVAKDYNKTKTSKDWNARCDINNDHIVDVYDIVKISSIL